MNGITEWVEKGRNWGEDLEWWKGILSKALPVRMETGAGRGGAQSWLFLNWTAKPFGLSPSPPPPTRFALKPLEQLIRGINRLGNSFWLHFLCSQVSRQVQPKPHGRSVDLSLKICYLLSQSCIPWESKCNLSNDITQGGIQEGRGRKTHNGLEWKSSLTHKEQLQSMWEGAASLLFVGPRKKKGSVHWGCRWHFSSSPGSHLWGCGGEKGNPNNDLPSELKEREM